MSRRGGGKFKPRAGFQKPDQPTSGVPSAMIKQARRSGQLNISNRNLTEVPSQVWRINIDVPEEARSVSLDDAEDRWWDQVELVKLILASNKLQEISNDINQLSALTVLDIHDNELSSLPETIGELSNLQRLNLSHNKLVSLPSELFSLVNLVLLHVQHNELCELGDELGSLINLEDLELHVGNNQLSELSKEHLQYLSNISVLDVRDNRIKTIPDEVVSLQALQRLDLTNNELSRGDCFAGSTELQHAKKSNFLRQRRSIYILSGYACRKCGLRALTLHKNMDEFRKKLQQTIKKRELLEKLQAFSSKKMRGTQAILKYLRSRIEEDSTETDAVGAASNPSSAMGVVSNVEGKTLDYSNKKATSVPSTIWQPAVDAAVTTINLSKNLLSDFPLNVVVLSNTCKELNLGLNKLSTIPPDLKMMVNLTTLDLRNNLIDHLPHDITTLVNLRDAILSCNRFKEIPPVLFCLSKLETIIIADNQVAFIDVQGLLRLPMLSTLDLQNNNVSQVPPELGTVESLRSLQLAGNPFRNPRAAILAKGTPALLEYLRDKIPR
ncbi:leucine-rich repeat-containing protein 40-like [Saccoglossus kowalevskii]|uniref:Leucine-rich repeat-containing protein 40-like n=1 Tax=Saccoglossus kowalevskii TaxID=10224 RepID=A0ABM0MKX0_SACKO|nr:PREDICTED: leucine-rich repeat-containing protein 40-like [Saccoglossus kowalevskii]